jgi:vancomycin resistance protein YoaR
MKKISALLHGKKNKKTFKLIGRILGVLSLIFGTLLTLLLLYNFKYTGRVFPNISIDGVGVGGLTPEEANTTLQDKFSVPEKIVLTSGSRSFDIGLNDFTVAYDFDASVNRAFVYTRTGNLAYDTIKRIELLKRPTHLGIILKLDEAQLSNQLQIIADEISQKPIYPSIQIVDGAVEVNKGTPGTVVDTRSLRILIGQALAKGIAGAINIPTMTEDPTLNEGQVLAIKNRAEKYLGKNLTLKFEFSEFHYKDGDLVKLLNPLEGYDKTETDKLVFKTAGSVNRDPQNPKFQFDGTRVTEFVPSLDGISLDTEKFKEALVSKMDYIQENPDKNTTLEIPVKRTKPAVSTQEVNSLGIKELIGRGTSTYYHSIPGRVYNVNLAASRINGSLVRPGETFSFNQTLGDVSKLTGYKEAYIISGGKTILGDGGGVCQVSTTLFRAILNAGLPVNERTAHAYRVGYYEQNSPAGLDATVYSPRPDFKFTNDTGHHILITAKNDTRNYSLVFELYGTGDGRTASISKPLVSNVSPPLPTIYQDDPNLPSGTLKQTDYAASGARVTFNYSVKRNGEEIHKKTFISNYQPWAAAYMRGTGPAQ